MTKIVLTPSTQEKVDKYLGQDAQPKDNYPTTVQQSVEQMKNADKLTPLEKGVYNVLPGFSQSSVGKALEWFSTTPVGKTLNVLDVLAEGNERATGLIWQLQRAKEHPEEPFNLKDAWYAGSLTADMTNMPMLKQDANGKVVGLSYPTDLPSQQGLADARQKIALYTSQGMSAHDAVIKVRDEYYNNIGALALRAQANDTVFHIVADPLNYLLPNLKPVEALQARRIVAMTQKSVITAERASELAEAAKLAGKVEEAAQLTERASKIAAGEVKVVNWADKFAIFMTGGDALNPSKASQALSKIPLLNAFQLTPESKAKELITLLNDNISTKIIARLYGEQDAEAKIVEAISRASHGATTEYGHALLTIEGRTAQGFMGGADAVANTVLENYSKLKNERILLQSIASQLGMTPGDVLATAEKKSEIMFRTLMAKASPEMAAAIERGEITADTFKTLSKMFKDLPYDKETFIVHLMAGIEDHAMRQAVTQFGVKEAGILTRWSQALKSAESLAFMRLNPSYGIRNLVNNDITMIARGVFGTMTGKEIELFWKEAGFTPARLKEGFHAASEIEKMANKTLQEAVTPKTGMPEKISGFFRNINLGKADVTDWSSAVEQAASKRAFTNGYIQFLQNFSDPVVASKVIGSDAADAIEQAAPGLLENLAKASKSSMGSEARFTRLVGENLNVSSQSIIDEASRLTGQKLEDVLDSETLAFVHQGLPDAVRSGKVDQFIFSVRQKMESHLEQMFQDNLDNLIGNVKNQVSVGGPQVFYDKIGEAQDLFWQAHIEHAIKTPDAVQLARDATSAGDLKLANDLWTKVMADDEKFYGRAFRRVDAYLQGLEQGAKEAGIPFPREVRQSFTNFRKNWQDFFEFRNNSYREFFDAKLKGKEYTKAWDQLQGEISNRYNKAVALEDSLQQSVDDVVASQIRDPGKRQIFTKYRDAMAEARKSQKEAVISFREQLADIPKEERTAFYNQFWAQQRKIYEDAKALEQTGRAAVQGNQQAAIDLQTWTSKYTTSRISETKAGYESFLKYAQEQGQNPADAVADWANYGPMRQKFAAEGPGPQTTIFDLAEQYGIASASEGGTRNDARILNTVNKYAPKVEKPAKNLAQKVIDTPRSELPPAVSERLAQEAKGLIDELYSGEPGKRIALAPGMESATNEWRFIGQTSTNAPWYRELNKDYGLGKSEVNKALEKIIADAGKDKGVNVKRVKELIVDRLRNGDPKMGVPPDLYALTSMGASREDLLDALDEFNDIAKTNYTLEDALVSSGMPIEEVATYVQGGMGGYKRVSEVPLSVAKQAFEAREAAKGAVQQTPPFLQDYKQIAPDLPPIDLGLDMTAYGRQYSALDSIADAAKLQADKAPVNLKNLSPALRSKVEAYLEALKSDRADARLAATRYGEFRRDSALLNYNRRTNFDTWVSNIFPYAFWTTGSIQKWAIESIDRPAMLTTYLRTKKFLETAGSPQQGFPTRFRDNLRVKLPFAPSWMGDQFIDPLRLALPFDAFLQPFEQAQASQLTTEGRATRLLQTALQNNEITQLEYEQATNEKAGPVWDNAVSQAQANDDSLKFDAWDFASLVSSPHAPLVWAYNAARGHPEDIGPFTPESRMVKNAATMLGVKDWNNSSWNLEGKLRKTLGLPAYDKWDNGYRQDRELSNMAAEGKIPLDDINRAMALSSAIQNGMSLEKAQQDPAWEVYQKAVERANQEYMGGPAGFVGGLLGMPVHAYPEGEQMQRQLQDDFSAAYEKYKNANEKIGEYINAHPDMSLNDIYAQYEKEHPETMKDAEALTKFFDDHPEYESRLALFDKPDERLRKFLVDNMWSKWNALPKVTRDELKDQLGDAFSEQFISKETRSYNSLSTEQMTVWLKMMGGKPIGTLSADQELVVDLFSGQLQLTKPETAWRAQTFYSTRDQNYPDWYEAQQAYYAPGANKQKVKSEYPDLERYWTWRRDYMTKNPDIVPYITDDQTAIDKAKKTQRNPETAVPTAEEIKVNLSPSMQNLIKQAQQGEDLPDSAEQYLELLAVRYGIGVEELKGIVGVPQ